VRWNLSDGVGLMVKWGTEGQGTEDEYLRELERERERLASDPDLVKFLELIDGRSEASEALGGEVGEVGEEVKGVSAGTVGTVRARQIHLSDDAWLGLQGLARERGFMRGSNPNVRAFLEDLGLRA
jgi:hypothetical protein